MLSGYLSLAPYHYTPRPDQSGAEMQGGYLVVFAEARQTTESGLII